MANPDLKKLNLLMEAYAKQIVAQAKQNLEKDKKGGGNLYNSLSYDLIVENGVFLLSFFMEDYGKYVDKGVRGLTSTYPETEKALSKFQYGSGTGPRGGLRKGITKWVNKKKFQFRDKKGRFMSYNDMTFLITRSIWNKGLRANTFFTRPLTSALKKLGDEFLESFILEIEKQTVFGQKN